MLRLVGVVCIRTNYFGSFVLRSPCYRLGFGFRILIFQSSTLCFVSVRTFRFLWLISKAFAYPHVSFLCPLSPCSVSVSVAFVIKKNSARCFRSCALMVSVSPYISISGAKVLQIFGTCNSPLHFDTKKIKMVYLGIINPVRLGALSCIRQYTFAALL